MVELMNKINIISPIGYTGYGVAGLNIVKELSKTHEVSLFQKGNPTVDNQEDADIVQKAILNQNVFDGIAPCLKIWHQFDLAEHIGSGKYLGFPFFELNSFNEKEITHVRCPDVVLSTSRWAADIVNSYRYDHSPVVPLGVDPSIFHLGRIGRKKPRNSFVILNVGKWEHRKGHDILVEIFNKAFTPKDNVELWLAPHNPFLNETQIKEWQSLYLTSDLGNKVWIAPRLQTHHDVADLMGMADIGIFPSRAEGWNLELLEMMALGKPVIATNYSAHTEYVDKDNCMLIEIEKNESAHDGVWFFGQGEWAYIGETQIEQAVSQLRRAYKTFREDGILTNLNGVATGQRYTWEHTANKIREVLNGS